MHGACEVGVGLPPNEFTSLAVASCFPPKFISIIMCLRELSDQPYKPQTHPTSPGSALPPFLAWCRYRVDPDNHSVSLVSAYYAPGTESDCRDTERAPLSSGPQPCGETELPLDNGNPVAWKGCVGESVRGRGGGEFRVKCIPRSGRP